jgi:threonine dehydrogenase-like Zn-dependent dehydrogenase
LVDTNPNRLKHTPVGAETVLGNDEGWKHIQQKFAPIGVEAVFMCLGGEATELFDKVKTLMSTSPDGISQGRIIFSGGATITLTLASTSGNLQIFSSAKAGPGYRDPAFEQGRDYPNSYVKWTVKRNMQVLLDAIARKLLVIKPLITHIYPFVDALEAYKKLAQPNTDALGVLLDYNV